MVHLVGSGIELLTVGSGPSSPCSLPEPLARLLRQSQSLLVIPHISLMRVLADISFFPQLTRVSPREDLQLHMVRAHTPQVAQLFDRTVGAGICDGPGGTLSLTTSSQRVQYHVDLHRPSRRALSEVMASARCLTHENYKQCLAPTTYDLTDPQHYACANGLRELSSNDVRCARKAAIAVENK